MDRLNVQRTLSRSVYCMYIHNTVRRRRHTNDIIDETLYLVLSARALDYLFWFLF